MLGIKNIATGETLELPGTTLELQQENPFLQFGDDITGDFSLPIDVKHTPNNQKFLDFVGLLNKRINNAAGIDVAIWDGGLQHSIGKLKVEKPTINVNRAANGSSSLYFLGGVASFYQDIKNKKLRDVAMGGARQFTWQGYNDSSGNGFWRHIHQVINAPHGYGSSGFDYAFYPVINKGQTWSIGTKLVNNEIVNSMWINPQGILLFLRDTTDHKDGNVIVPMPYYKYVLDRVAESIGWQIKGNILQDPDFLDATLVNFRAIDWANVMEKPLGTPVAPKNNIEFNLADHMPDMTLPEFFVAMKNRFGWWYDFDKKQKIITINSLSDVATTTIKDVTAEASPVVVKTINKESKIYALKNNFYGDYAGGGPDFTTLNVGTPVNEKWELRGGSAAEVNQVRLVRQENNFYMCRQVDDNHFIWEFYAYNVYDYAPKNYTDEITTSCTTLGNEFYTDYLDFVPRMDLNIQWIGHQDAAPEFGLHVLFYKGLQKNRKGQNVPFACSGIYNAQGVQVAQWSLAYECFKYDGTDVGLYARNWKPVLKLLESAEEVECNLNLDIVQWLNLKFSDVISIKNMRIYMKTIKSQIPYKGIVNIQGVRI